MPRTLADIHYHHHSALSKVKCEGVCAWADTPGQEKGYLVQMTDDTLVPPYQLKPGQNVTIISKYSADDKHYGKDSHLLSRQMCCMRSVCLYPCLAPRMQIRIWFDQSDWYQESCNDERDILCRSNGPLDIDSDELGSNMSGR